jgi:hypothetical protein
MLVVYIVHLHNLTAAQTDALRIILGVRRVLGDRSISQLPVVDIRVYFSAVSYSNMC